METLSWLWHAKSKKERITLSCMFIYHLLGLRNGLRLLPPLHPDQQLQFLGFGGHRTSACSTRHREWAAGGPRPGGRASQLEEVRELEDKLPDTPRVHSRNSNADRSLYERNHDRGGWEWNGSSHDLT